MSSPYTEAVSQMIARRDQRIVLPPAGVPLLHQHFSVGHERKELQLLAWRDYLDRLLDVPLTRQQLAHGFVGEIDAYLPPDMVYLDNRTGAFSQSRSLARISRDSMRDFVFHVAVHGMMETTTRRAVRASQYTPGILALDMSQPMQMVRPMAARVLAFFLPRAMVQAAIADPETIHGRVIGYTTPLTRLILERVKALCSELPRLAREDQAEAIRMCDLHREDLSPDSVMQAFPVARSTIYRMFVPHGGLHAYIRHCRLREAAQELVVMPQLSVTAIGYGLGFNSASDFSRAFSRQYDMSPRDYRAQTNCPMA